MDFYDKCTAPYCGGNMVETGPEFTFQDTSNKLYCEKCGRGYWLYKSSNPKKQTSQ